MQRRRRPNRRDLGKLDSFRVLLGASSSMSRLWVISAGLKRSMYYYSIPPWPFMDYLRRSMPRVVHDMSKIPAYQNERAECKIHVYTCVEHTSIVPLVNERSALNRKSDSICSRSSTIHNSSHWRMLCTSRKPNTTPAGYIESQSM